MRNTQLGGLITGLLILILSFFIVLIPFVFSLDMMRAGYGTICIGIFLSITGTITFLMFLGRYIKLNSILRGENLLVHWEYSKERYFSRIRKKLEEDKTRNKYLLIIVWIFFILFSGIFAGIGFLEGEEDSLWLFFVIMGSVLGIVTLFGVLMPHVDMKNAMSAIPEVFISKKGMYFMGQLHTWNPPLFILKNVELSPDKKQLLFSIRYFTKLGWFKYEEYLVRVPVPEGKIKEAENVIKSLCRDR